MSGLSNLFPVVLALLAIAVAINWRRPRRRTWTLAVVVATVAVVGVAETRHASRIFPLADIAVLELYVRNALTGTLLVGPYSRFGWHHPGPMYFYLIAPLYALAGWQAPAMAAGAAMLFAAGLAVIAWAAMRSLGSILTAALLGSVALFVWRLPDLVTSPWNPHVVVIPTVALLVVCALLASGDWTMSPVSVLIASFIAQTDVALVPLVAMSVGTAHFAAVSAARRRGDLKKVGMQIGATAGVLVLCWFLPFVEQLTRSPGNVTLLLRFFLSGSRSGQTFPNALDAWAAMIAAPAGLTMGLATGGTFVADAAGRSFAITIGELLAVGMVGAWAAVSGRRPVAWLATFALLASVVGLWSVTHIEEHIMDHEVFWLTAIGILNLGLIAGAAGVYVLSHLGRPEGLSRFVAPIVQAALIVTSVSVCFSQLERARAGHLPVTSSLPAVERLGASVRNHLKEEQVALPLVRIGEDVWGITAGVLLELDRADVAFTVEDSWLPMFPHAFTSNGREDAELTFSDAMAHNVLAARPGNELVASSNDVYVDEVRGRAEPR